jgi:exodeoxyribonuclease III
VKSMKLISWNVNGLRAVHRKGNWADIFEHSPDILCLQETKCTPEQLTEEVRSVPGFHSYFFSPKERSGYSGVALYSKEKPERVSYGFGTERFDVEGRVIEAEFSDFVLFNVYFPNGGQGAHRIAYKLDFYESFLEHIEEIRRRGKNVIFCGDVNTAHEPIDLARPKENEENTGFLPEEREWIDEVISRGYIDTFRHLNPEKATYSYWDLFTRARDRNVGWRIDYVFLSQGLLPRLKNAFVLGNVYGSDHCPVGAELV